MATPVELSALGLGIASPKHEYEMLTLLVQDFHDAIGEALPALCAMARRPALFDREYGIQQQDTLLRPRNK